MCVYAPCIGGACSGQKRVSDPWNWVVGDGEPHGIQFLSKSSQSP